LNSLTKLKKNLPKHLAADVSKVGIKRLLKSLKVDALKALASKLEEEKQNTRAKNVLVKRIYDALADNPKAYFESLDAKHLKPTCENLDISGGNKAKQIEQILQVADEFGLDHCFSSFPVSVLQAFTSSCGLTVQTSSVEILVDCLIKQTNFKKKKKEKKELKVSDKQPNIKKGISKIDLHHWYYRNELGDWCKENGLKNTGNKKELVDRILEYLDDPAKAKEKAEKAKNKKSAGGKRKKDSEKSDQPTKKAKKM